MDSKIESSETRALAEIYKKGFMYRGIKPVNWCFDCKSALAEAEIEYGDKDTFAILVLFPSQKKNSVTLKNFRNL